jgi:hypothetical protein
VRLLGSLRRPRLKHVQPGFGVSDNLSKAGFGARVFRKAQNGAHPQNAMPEPTNLIFDFDGHEPVHEYPEFQVHPEAGSGPLCVGGTAQTGFNGAIAHLAVWNRLLSQDEIASIWTQGAADLGVTPT